MSPEEVGSILAIASLLGIPGGFGCVLLGTRFGRAIPLFIGLAASVVGVTLLALAQGPLMYAISAYILGFTWAFTLPYYQAAQAALCPHGSVVAAGSFSGTMGNAAGPGLAGMAVLFGGYNAVLLMAGAMLLVSIFCIPNLIFKVRKIESTANSLASKESFYLAVNWKLQVNEQRIFLNQQLIKSFILACRKFTKTAERV